MAVTFETIVEIMAQYPEGIKAKRIAWILGVMRKDVNHVIYKNKYKGYYYQDSEYKWHLA